MKDLDYGDVEADADRMEYDLSFPKEIRKFVKWLRERYSLGRDDVYLNHAEHEELPEGSYSVGIECVFEWVFDEEVLDYDLGSDWWKERINTWCLAIHPNK